MLKAVRHQAVLDLLRVRGPLGIGEIVDALGVSAATARRDLSELDEQRLVNRTWGGVQLVAEDDDPFQEALGRHGAEKQRIACAAAALVPDGITVIVDIGTTAHYLALELRGRDVTVMTASLPAFECLRAAGGPALTMLGGHWSEQYQCFEGQPVIDVLEHQQADLAFVGCSGVSESGRVRDTSSSQSAIKRAIRRAATRTYLLADASKFPGKGDTSPFDVGELDGVITVQGAMPRSLAERCQMQQLEVEFA